MRVVVDIAMSVTYQLGVRALTVRNRSCLYIAGAVVATIGLLLQSESRSLVMYTFGNIVYAIGWALNNVASTSFLLDLAYLFVSKKVAYVCLIRAFNVSPKLVTALAAPPLASYFGNLNWRWSYRTFAIIAGAMSAGMVACLVTLHLATSSSTRRRDKQHPPHAQEGLTRRAWKLLAKWDLLGVFLLCGGLALALVPFSLIESVLKDWYSQNFIGMMVGGLFMLVGFCGVEFARGDKAFFPIRQLKGPVTCWTCPMTFICGGKFRCSWFLTTIIR